MSFVTDEMVRVAEDAGDRAIDNDGDYMRAALEAVAPLWLAHVRAASEHTADYQMAAAAAEIERQGAALSRIREATDV